MSKGNKIGVWSVRRMYSDHYYAERIVNGQREYHELHTAHCMSCAKLQLITRYGGRVDLRGANDMCGGFLRISQDALLKKEN